MRPFRVSIRGLMALVLFVAFGFVALRYASETWAGLVVMMTLGVLILAFLGIVYRRGARRAFWVGFVLLGWGYIAYSTDFLWQTIEARTRPTMGSGIWGSEYKHPPLVTTRFLDWLYPSLHRDQGSAVSSGMFGRLMADGKSQRILDKLEAPFSMPFPNETPLEDVVHYIKTATVDPNFPQGIPIYVDPVGLQEAEKTLASPIQLNLDGVPLRVSLQLLLRQLDLTYRVRDGLLTITSDTLDEGSPKESFGRIGHAYFALLAALLGGLAGRIFFATRDEGERSPRETTLPGASG